MAASATTMRAWNPTYNHSDRERWICIYPIYINAKKTESEGRRIAKARAVDNPTITEIKDVLTAAGIPIFPEDKYHPRERDRNHQGRVRVQLKDKEDNPINAQFTKKDDILEYICQRIPMLKTRGASQSSQQQHASASQTVASSSGAAKKNKGKKK